VVKPLRSICRTRICLCGGALGRVFAPVICDSGQTPTLCPHAKAKTGIRACRQVFRGAGFDCFGYLRREKKSSTVRGFFSVLPPGKTNDTKRGTSQTEKLSVRQILRKFFFPPPPPPPPQRKDREAVEEEEGSH